MSHRRCHPAYVHDYVQYRHGGLGRDHADVQVAEDVGVDDDPGVAEHVDRLAGGGYRIYVAQLVMLMLSPGVSPETCTTNTGTST
jgi:hypothetical protein